jgi:hypothetical protein
MPDGERTLLDYNNRGVLANLLAIEEHLEQLSRRQISHSWCIQKHGIIALDHHLREAIIHSAQWPDVQQGYIMFSEQLARALERPQIVDIRRLRNEFRVMISEPTASSSCPVCSADGITRKSSWFNWPLSADTLFDYAVPVVVVLGGLVLVRRLSKKDK